MPSLRPTKVAKWLGLAYAAGTAWLVLGDIANAPELLLSAPFAWAWLTGPAALAAMLVKAARTRLGAGLFVLMEAAIAASTIAFLVDTTVHRAQWSALGAALTLGVSGPLCQYGAVGAVFAAASLFGWRARREWLEA